MKRKSVWLSFTACALTAASVPLPARAVQRTASDASTQVSRVQTTVEAVVPTQVKSTKGAQKSHS